MEVHVRKAIIAAALAAGLVAATAATASASPSCYLQDKLGVKNVMACEGPPGS